MKFKNDSDNVFTDISSEAYRTYEFPKGDLVTITKPLKLSVSRSGGHRVFDEGGTSHYVPKGWIHLHWKPREGQANFVK